MIKTKKNKNKKEMGSKLVGDDSGQKWRKYGAGVEHQRWSLRPDDH